MYVVHSYLDFLSKCFLQLYDIKSSFLIQIICTKLYGWLVVFYGLFNAKSCVYIFIKYDFKTNSL